MGEISFRHLHGAHCESGVTASLLQHYGLPVSEPLAFGIGSGLYFVHLPFLRFFGAPTISFRSIPGTIFRKTCKRLGVRYEMRRYRNQERGMADLEATVGRGFPVGVQANIFWLTYVPRRFRFQFNAHNLVVYGRRDDTWLVSDPVFETPAECPNDSLRRARFGKGLLAPRGRMYLVAEPPRVGEETLKAAVRAGALNTAWAMTRIPLPVVGARGILYLANRMERWPTHFAEDGRALALLADVVRMLEEIGTGGAGFRYLFAAFLQEGGTVLGDSRYAELSQRLTAIGDAWRGFSARSARVCRSRRVDAADFRELADMVRECGRQEGRLFSELYEHESARRALGPRPALLPEAK